MKLLSRGPSNTKTFPSSCTILRHSYLLLRSHSDLRSCFPIAFFCCSCFRWTFFLNFFLNFFLTSFFVELFLIPNRIMRNRWLLESPSTILRRIRWRSRNVYFYANDIPSSIMGLHFLLHRNTCLEKFLFSLLGHHS